jgi:hypothetical protein
MLSPRSHSIEPPRRDRITAISSVAQRRPIVVVLGMHRSGTSVCAHILSALGVDIADKIPGPGATSAHPSNPRGHWERWEIVEFHDRLLDLFNRDYLGRFHDFALPVAWWADPRVAEIRREIVAFLQRRLGDGYFGFKDPRTVRLMPVWHQIFNELKLAPKIVLCLRNPAQVARSLHARDGLDPAIGEYRWLVHIIDFYRYTSNFDCCLVEYEEWFDNPATNIEKLQTFLHLPWQQSEADLRLVLSGIIDPTARHDDSPHRKASQPLVRTLYKLAGQVDRDAAARDQIAYIVSQFVSFQQLQSPLLQTFEDVAKTATKYREIEQEVAALRMQVSEHDTRLAAAQLRAGAAETRLAEALTENEGQRVQISELSKRHEDQEAALQRAEQDARDRDSATAAIQAEIVALRDTLAQAESEAQQREAAATAFRGEIATLRDTLAQAEREGRQRAATERGLQAEVVTLRARLAQVEPVATERRAVAAALQVEIAALQCTLSTAREVGKTAVAAFRLDMTAPAKPPRSGGWRWGIARFFGAQPSL